MDKSLLRKDLNFSQFAAVTHEGSPLLIIAGAGSGKTRTLVHRVAWLLTQGIPAEKILLLTFTRKAANEMLSRVIDLVGPVGKQVRGGTFHALANSLVRQESRILGFPSGFGILDQDDAENFLGRIRESFAIHDETKKFPKKNVLYAMISQSVNREVPLATVIQERYPVYFNYLNQLDKISEIYVDHKRINAVMDFDDLLLGLVTILRDHEDARLRLAAKFSHILVDEYQDTNPVQARITWLLGKDHFNVTAVGDEAQSIYSFRGADFRNILDFPKIFPKTRIIKLEENYRSYQPILSLANGIMLDAKEKFNKHLVATRGEGTKPKAYRVEDFTEEAHVVVQNIQKLLENNVRLDQIAVLFRASAHSFELELLLTRLKIPFTKYGGRKFLEAAHVKDFLAFFRAIANPYDTLSLSRILTMIPGVGPKRAQEICDWVGGDRQKLSTLRKAPLQGKSKTEILDLSNLFKKIALTGETIDSKPMEIYNYYKKLLPNRYPEDYKDRDTDVLEIVRMASEANNLTDFLVDVTLDPPNNVSHNVPNQSEQKDLTLSTIHSAKGLEWNYVFLLSVVEGRFPTMYGVKKDSDLEEERRLLYVAITRAKDGLFILLPEAMVGYMGTIELLPNRFLDSLPQGFMETYWHGKQIHESKVFRGAKHSRPWNEKPLSPAVASEYERFGEKMSSFDYIVDQIGPKYVAQGEKVPDVVPIEASRTENAVTKGEKTNLKINFPKSVKNVLVSNPTPGETVEHTIFGTGVIKSIKEDKVLVDFDIYGCKLINLKDGKLFRKVQKKGGKFLGN
ncbi:MAG: ATP-dependent helicase [Deltaproteobacteria bacterium]|nr:ATP-dependent helicase [Deltaproteobacteria bacterium]